MIQTAKAFLTRTVLPAALIVATGYNAAMMVNGPEGQRAEAVLVAEIAKSRAELAEARGRTTHLASRADGLLLASLDHDLLEERLRARLGLTRPGEYMVRMQDLDEIAGTETTDDDSIELAHLDGRRRGEPRTYRR